MNCLTELCSNQRAATPLPSQLHAKFWASPRLEGDLSWLPTPCSGGMAFVFEQIGEGLIRDHVRRHAFGERALRHLA